MLICTCFSKMSERLLDVENEAMLKIVELEKQLMQTNKELDHLRVSAVTMETKRQLLTSLPILT